MNSIRPHSSSKELSAETTEDFDRQSNILANLFPDVPRFTVSVAVAFPHTPEDISDEQDGGSDAPILDCCTLHVRAVNVHTAVDIVMSRVGQEIREAMGDDADFTLICVSAFVGHHVDIANNYDYSKSAFYSTENAIEDYEGVAA